MNNSNNKRLEMQAIEKNKNKPGVTPIVENVCSAKEKKFPFTSTRYYPLYSPKHIDINDFLSKPFDLSTEEYVYTLTSDTLSIMCLSDTFNICMRRGGCQITFTKLIAHFFIVINTISVYHNEYYDYLNTPESKAIFGETPFCYIYQYLMTVEGLLDAKRSLHLDEISLTEGKALVSTFRSKVDRLLYNLRVTPNELYNSFLRMIDLFSRVKTHIKSYVGYVEVLEFARNVSIKHKRLAMDYHINYMNRTISLNTLSNREYAEYFHPEFMSALSEGYYKNPKNSPEQVKKDLECLR